MVDLMDYGAYSHRILEQDHHHYENHLQKYWESESTFEGDLG